MRTQKPQLTRTELAQMPDAAYVSIPEAALFCQVTIACVENWLRQRYLKRHKAGLGEKGRTLIRLGDLREFVREA